MEALRKDCVWSVSGGPPDESTLMQIANAALNVGSARKALPLKVTRVSSKSRSHTKSGKILEVFASVQDEEKIFSVLMKEFSPNSPEIQAYSTLFRDMQPQSLQTIYNSSSDLYEIIPRAYLVQKTVLFTENLDHFRPGHNTAQLQSWMDFNHSLLAVETLARFHANSYCLRKQLAPKGQGKFEMLQKYPFLNQHSSSPYSSQMRSQLAPVFEQAFDLAVRVIQQANPSLAFKLQRKTPNPEGIYEKLVTMLEHEKYENDDFYVACHGNFLPGSLLFSYEDKEPVACRITNFSSMFFGPLASDLALFLLTSTTFEFRQEFEEKLLAFYCDAFQEQVISRFGRNTPAAQQFEENIDEFHRKVEKQYRKMLEFAFYNACVLLPIILYETSPSDTTDNNNQTNPYEYPCINSLTKESQSQKYFPQNSNMVKGEAPHLEKFALDSSVLKDRLVEILKQLGKLRVINL